MTRKAGMTGGQSDDGDDNDDLEAERWRCWHDYLPFLRQITTGQLYCEDCS
jgi:hypothetical protein